MRSEEQEREAYLAAFQAYAHTHMAITHRVTPSNWPNHSPWFEAGWNARAALARAPDAGEAEADEEDAFEQLCREHEIAGTVAARQCEVFWRAGAAFHAPHRQQYAKEGESGIDWKAEYDGAQEVLTEIRTALNASGYWPLGMDLVASIRGLLAATPPVAVQAEPVRRALEDFAEYTGEGPINADWRGMVRRIGRVAREALAAHPKPAAPATVPEPTTREEAIALMRIGAMFLNPSPAAQEIPNLPAASAPAAASELPPLPEADWVLQGSAKNRDGYTADQMREYGRLCVAAALQGRAQEGEPSELRNALRGLLAALAGKRPLGPALDKAEAALAQAQKDRVQGDAARAGGEG